MLSEQSTQQLALDAGRSLYELHSRRPRVSGGPGKTTSKRYRAVFDKFLAFAAEQGIDCWNQVTATTLNAYGMWLEERGYAYATSYLELTTLKQVIKFFVEEHQLPRECLFKYSLRKARGTKTYCWRAEEVEAILTHCEESQELHWLRDVVIALALTGLRISELAALRWSDVDLVAEQITLADETSVAPSKLRGERRTTKSGSSRTLAIHPQLLAVLKRLPKFTDNRLFHGPLGGKIKPDTVRRILIRDVLTPLQDNFPSATDGSGFEDGRLHSFRHYFCSRCANEGIAEQVLISWLGHQNSRMVRHYYHLHDQQSRQQIRRLKPLKSPGSRDPGSLFVP